MKRNRWVVIIGSIVVALVAIAVSVRIGGGWALVLVEVGGAVLAVVLFLRGQRDDDLELGDP